MKNFDFWRKKKNEKRLQSLKYQKKEREKIRVFYFFRNLYITYYILNSEQDFGSLSEKKCLKTKDIDFGTGIFFLVNNNYKKNT